MHAIPCDPPRDRPKETRFISPSFTGNFFSCPDLNAITPESSPAFTLQTERPNGDQYAKYLREMTSHMGVEVVTNTEVTGVLVEKRKVEQPTKEQQADLCKLHVHEKPADPDANDGPARKRAKREEAAEESGAVASGANPSHGVADTNTAADAAGNSADSADLLQVQQELCVALQTADLAEVKVLLQERGADPMKPGGVGTVSGVNDALKLPMYFAAKGGNMAVVALLLEHGADVHVAIVDPSTPSRCGATALFVAAQIGHIAVVALLIKHGADVNRATSDEGQTPLYAASQKGHAKVVSMLLNEGADPNQADNGGRTPLWIASGNGLASIVGMLLKHGADPTQSVHEDGASPLFISSAFGQAKVVAKLLKHEQTDPNQPTSDIGATPLYIAAEGGHGSVAAELLGDSRTDPNKPLKADGASPLFCAAAFGHIEVVAELLKRHDIDVNQPDHDGTTPLSMAAREGHLEVVEMLLGTEGAARADPAKMNEDGETPLGLAKQNGHTAIVALLRGKDGTDTVDDDDLDEDADNDGIADDADDDDDDDDLDDDSDNDDISDDAENDDDTDGDNDQHQGKSGANRFLAELDDKLPDITIRTAAGDYTSKFVIWAGGEFQYPKTIPQTVRVGHGTGYSGYADLPRGNHVVIGGGESGVDITHFLVGLGDTVTILDASAPWNSRESDSSLGLSPYTFDRLNAFKATGKVTLIAERAESITATEVKTKTHTFKLTSPAIDATGYDISKSIAGKLFNFEDGVPKITKFDESTISKNVFLVGPHVRHDKAVFCFIYKYRQRFAVIAKEIMARLGMTTQRNKVIGEYAKKNFLLEDLSDCGTACPC